MAAAAVIEAPSGRHVCVQLDQVPKLHAIAWDADHTIVRYQLPAVMSAIYHGLASYLLESGFEWAREALEAAPDLPWMQRGLVFEIRSGDVLKLSATGAVTRAFHGTKPKSLDDYCGVWERFDDLVNRKRHPDFAAFLTWFDVPAILVLARLVDAIDATPSCGVTYAAAFKMLLSGFDHIFDNVDGFRGSRGSFFESLATAPESCLLPRPRLRRALLALRARGIRQILATNSHFRFADFCLRASLGDDYRSLFDLVIVSCFKGRWFHGPSAVVGGPRFRRMCDTGWKDGGVARSLSLGPLGPAAEVLESDEHTATLQARTSAEAAFSAARDSSRRSKASAAAEDDLASAPRTEAAKALPLAAIEDASGRLASLANQVDLKERMLVAATVFVRGNATDVERVIALDARLGGISAAPTSPDSCGSLTVGLAHAELVESPVSVMPPPDVHKELMGADGTLSDTTGKPEPAVDPAVVATLSETLSATNSSRSGNGVGSGALEPVETSEFRSAGILGATEHPGFVGRGSAWERPNILYVGDHPHGDVVAAKHDAGWLSAAIVEEMQIPVTPEMPDSAPSASKVGGLAREVESVVVDGPVPAELDFAPGSALPVAAWDHFLVAGNEDSWLGHAIVSNSVIVASDATLVAESVLKLSA